MRIIRKKVLIFVLCLIFAVTLVTAFFIYKNNEIKSLKYITTVEKWCKEYNVDVYIALATIEVESGGDENAVSNVGAIGLMQLMPKTADWIAKECGVETNDYFAVDTNIRLGVAYLSYLSKKFDGDMVFCAYNAGEGVVKKWIEDGGEIKYKETREYVEKIKNMIKRIKNKVYLY